MHAFNCIPHYDADDDDDCNDDDGLGDINCYLLLMLMMAVMMTIEEDSF